MTDEPRSDAEMPRTKKFRRRFPEQRLSAAAAERQGRIAHLAWVLIGDRDDAITFLNEPHAALGGRPIDLAIASEIGCTAVEQAIAERAAHR